MALLWMMVSSWLGVGVVVHQTEDVLFLCSKNHFIDTRGRSTHWQTGHGTIMGYHHQANYRNFDSTSSFRGYFFHREYYGWANFVCLMVRYDFKKKCASFALCEASQKVGRAITFWSGHVGAPSIACLACYKSRCVIIAEHMVDVYMMLWRVNVKWFLMSTPPPLVRCKVSS